MQAGAPQISAAYKPGGGITVDLERSRDIRETGFGLVYDFRRGYSGQG